MSAPDRIAVVVVHGIADQRAGQTVRDFVRLLCHGGAGEPRYVQGELHEVLVPVAKLEPGGSASRPATTSSTGDGRKAETSRPKPGTPSGFYQAQKSVPAVGPVETGRCDLGIALNDYLLGRLELSDRDALYESTRVSLRRRANNRPVDIFELYWADLSRVGEGGLRALSALYQLFFGIGTLAPDVVDQILLSVGGGRAWRLLQRMHAWLAWLMKCPVALVQLSILLLALFGAATLVPLDWQEQFVPMLFAIGAILLSALALLTWLRGTYPARRRTRLMLLLAAAVACAAAAVASSDGTRLIVMYFAANALVIAVLGAWLIESYSRVTHGVRVFGHLLISATVIGLCLDGYALLPHVATQSEWMLTAALNMGEWLLAAMLLVWAVYVTLQALVLALGLWLGRGVDHNVRKSLETSSLAVVASTALFAVLGVVLCSVINYVARDQLGDFLYLPVIFGSGYRSGQIFLDDRILTLAGFFMPLVLAFTMLALVTLVVLAPSLVEEIFPTTNIDARGRRREAAVWSQRLGKWLDGGVWGLKQTFALVVQPGAIIAGALYLAFVYRHFAFSTGPTGEWAKWAASWLDYMLGGGKWLAGASLMIAALGSRYTRTFLRLRVAIDAALDVQNYFRDPPNRQPPRARIYSRYASLLAYLRDRGYVRIVIVSHSQGTVISADLLRYLHVQGRLPELVGGIPITLVTVGSPLRDLYAERFPLLYRWMGSNDTGFATAAPRTSDIGAIEWVNAYRSGDYVGRFLWTREPAYRIAVVGADGRIESERAGGRAEFCLGAGAHTRYFSNDAVALAVEIDRLVEGE